MATTTTNFSDNNVAAGGSSTLGGNSANNEYITATGANDTLLGGSGSDTLVGVGSNDTFDAYGINPGTGAQTTYAGQSAFPGGSDYLTAGGNPSTGDTFLFGPTVAGAGLIFTVYGSAGNDTITSHSTLNDTAQIYGDAGNDTIFAGQGHETIYGGQGNDSITPYAGAAFSPGPGGTGNADFVSGDAGDDTISGFTGNLDTIYGGAGNDSITGITATNDYISGGDGNDIITATGAITTIYGGTGNDVINGGGINDYISGDNGDDRITAAGAKNTIYGGDGNDVIIANGANDQVYGNAGNDTISIAGSGTTVYAGAGNDLVNVGTAGGTGNNFISADLGNDTVNLTGLTLGNDTVYGGAGDDTIYGAQNTTGVGDVLYGQSGNDTITLQGVSGTIYGGQGNDLLYDGGNNNSFISGDLGLDSIFASGMNDTLYGGDGNDSIAASGGGNDAIFGQTGNDIISFTSAAGTATIYGGQGNDLITVTFGTSSTPSQPATIGTAGNSYYDAYTGATVQGGSAAPTYNTVAATVGTGAHYLSGDLGSDTISGGSGGDTFIGGAGSDMLTSHRLAASGNDPSAAGYVANGSGPAAQPGVASNQITAGNGGPSDPDGTATTGTPSYVSPHPAALTTSVDSFIFYTNDSTAAAPALGGTGSDAANGGEANLDHVYGFLLNVSGQSYTSANGQAGVTSQPYINAQSGDNLYFITGAHTLGGANPAVLDTNVFYGTTYNVVANTTAPVSEASDYAVAYQYAFGTGGTAAAPTSSAHFANAVDYIVVDVIDSTSNGGAASTNNNGNIFVFDHNGNGVALDGAALASSGTTGTFENTATPGGTGVVNGSGTSQTTVNIYH